MTVPGRQLMGNFVSPLRSCQWQLSNLVTSNVKYSMLISNHHRFWQLFSISLGPGSLGALKGEDREW